MLVVVVKRRTPGGRSQGTWRGEMLGVAIGMSVEFAAATETKDILGVGLHRTGNPAQLKCLPRMRWKYF